MTTTTYPLDVLSQLTKEIPISQYLFNSIKAMLPPSFTPHLSPDPHHQNRTYQLNTMNNEPTHYVLVVLNLANATVSHR